MSGADGASSASSGGDATECATECVTDCATQCVDVRAPAAKLGKYMAPRWSCVPDAADAAKLRLEVVRAGVVLPPSISIGHQAFYVIGRQPDVCHIEALHPSTSRQHAVIQHGPHGRMFLYDMGSSHGTFVNKARLPAGKFVPLHVGDVIRFGQSSRLYAVDGPDRLRPPEWQTFAAPLPLCPAAAASAALEDGRDKKPQRKEDDDEDDDDEDALEGDSDEDSDVDVEDYFNIASAKFTSLSAKQRSTRDRILRRRRKIANIEEEAKTLSMKMSVNGKLSSGQQQQLQRCHERVAKLTHELDNEIQSFAETIRDSRRSRRSDEKNEAQAAQRAKQRAKRTRTDADSDEDDEFYDRTQQQRSKQQRHKVETQESLQKKLDALQQQRENLQQALDNAAAIAASSSSASAAAAAASGGQQNASDSLDDYMRSMKRSIKDDEMRHIQQQLDEVTKEYDRLQRLHAFVRPAAASLPLPERSSFTSANIRRSDQIPVKQKRVEAAPEATSSSPSPPSSPSSPKAASSGSSLRQWMEEQRLQQQRETYSLVASDKLVCGGLVTRKKAECASGRPVEAIPQLNEAQQRVEEFMAAWKPPQGQSGDGRTNLNAKFGY